MFENLNPCQLQITCSNKGKCGFCKHQYSYKTGLMSNYSLNVVYYTDNTNNLRIKEN